jgi:rRNA processing protein Gar1
MAVPSGLEELDIKVYVDYPQERKNRLGPYVFATDGTQVDAGTQDNCMIDPVTLSVFGKPLPRTPEWNDATTPCTGNYARFQLADFTFTGTGGSSNWTIQDYKKTGNTYIICKSDSTPVMSQVIQLTAGVKRNEPLFFSFSKLEKKNSNDEPLIKLYWANSSNNDKDIQLHFSSDGSCSVYRGYLSLSGVITTSTSSTTVTGNNTKFMSELSNGTVIYDQYGRLIGTVANRASNTSLTLVANALKNNSNVEYNKKQPNKVQTYSRTESNYSQGRPISTIANPNDQYNDVYIIPCRGNSLLILTSYGLNFCHAFTDLNVPDPPANFGNYDDVNDSSTPIITPSGSFSIQIAQGKAAFQLAKLYFLSNWSIKSQNITTESAPPAYPTFLTGDISGTLGSPTITGTATLFTTELNVGDRVYIYPDSQQPDGLIIGYVQTITNDTSFELSADSEYTFNAKTFSKDNVTTGDITFTVGNGAISGTGTLFTSEVNLDDALYDNNGNFIGVVDSIISDTNLTITPVPSFSGVSETFWTNINLYINRFINAQAEPFKCLPPVATDQVFLQFYVTDLAGNTNPFNNFTSDVDRPNSQFRIKIFQTNLDDADPLASTDYGYMFYSIDDVYTLRNEITSNSTVDITAAIEQLSIDRSEQGGLSLRLTGRNQLLEDAGMIKPDITSNRSIKVQLEPRLPALLSGLISFNDPISVYGQDTLFLSELNGGDTIYANDGTAIGIVDYIIDDFELALLDNFIGGTVDDIEYTNLPNYNPIILFEGYLMPPQINYIQGENYDKYALLEYEAIDKNNHLNLEYYSEAPNFDNTDLETIFKTNIIFGGSGNNNPNTIDLYVSPTLSTYQVSQNRSNSSGQYNFVANLGDNVGGYLEKLRSDFAQNFTFFSKGTWYPSLYGQNQYIQYNQFQLLDLDFIPDQSPFVSLYLNETSANNDGGIPIYDAYKRTLRSLRKTYEKPEANRIFIVGLDKATGDRLQLLLNDNASQNPYLAPALRPQNWLGDVNPFVMINDKLNTKTDISQAANQFYSKLTPGREIVELEADLLTYFDFTTRFIPNNITPLLGSITCSTSSQNVIGFSTDFVAELAVGDSIYDVNGVFIGIVQSISTTSALTLVSNAAITHTTDIAYNNFTVYKNEFDYLDIGDVFYLNDLEGNPETYRIIEWNCNFIKETTTSDTINVRRAVYRAKKVSIPANNPPIIAYAFNTIPAANQWIVTQGYELIFSVVALVGQFENAIFSLVDNPSGMVIDSATGEITWTPTSGQQNNIYSNIGVNVFDGTGNTLYRFTVRTYSTL